MPKAEIAFRPSSDFDIRHSVFVIRYSLFLLPFFQPRRMAHGSLSIP